MKTIGMIGGMSWESSIEYYRIINEAVNEQLGHLHSTRNLMVSMDFTENGLLVLQADSRLPLFDTTRIHALAAVQFALQA